MDVFGTKSMVHLMESIIFPIAILLQIFTTNFNYEPGCEVRKFR